MNVFRDYDAGDFIHAMFLPTGDTRPQTAGALDRIGDGELLPRRRAPERALLAMGIAPNVHGDGKGREESLPFDVVPRSLEGAERGLTQPVLALDAFAA